MSEAPSAETEKAVPRVVAVIFYHSLENGGELLPRKLPGGPVGSSLESSPSVSVGGLLQEAGA